MKITDHLQLEYRFEFNVFQVEMSCVSLKTKSTIILQNFQRNMHLTNSNCCCCSLFFIVVVVVVVVVVVPLYSYTQPYILGSTLPKSQ